MTGLLKASEFEEAANLGIISVRAKSRQHLAGL